MSYIKTAPDLKPRVADLIRRFRKAASDGTLRHGPLDQRGREEAGRYVAVGGARVEVHATAHHSEEFIFVHGQAPTNEHRVEVGAVAKCHGDGCIDPEFEQTVNNYWLLMTEDADKPAARVMEPVQAAREWAQAHAETCRAQPYTGQ